MKKIIDSRGFIVLALGVVYLWFGALKFFPGVSPAEDLARRTIDNLTLGYIPDPAGLYLLAAIESLVGLSLLTGVLSRTAMWIAIVHICLCFTPMVFEPATIWDNIPFDFTLTGQYIAKNLVLLAAMFSVLPRMR